MHVPAVSVPSFTGPAGLPVDAYAVGKPNRDRDLFAFANWIHRKLVSSRAYAVLGVWQCKRH